MITSGTGFLANSLLIPRKSVILPKFEFVTPTIIKLIPILFSTLGAFISYNVSFVVISIYCHFKK